MVFTVSLIFMDIRNFVNKQISDAYQSKAARNLVDRSERITPYNNYEVWMEANKIYEIFPNNSFDIYGNDLLKINFLYVFASGHPLVRNFNDLSAPYYDQGLPLVNQLLDNIFSNTNTNYQEMVRQYLLNFATGSGAPNKRAIEAGQMVNKVITLEDLRLINIHAATMVVNDYLNSEGLKSFGTKVNTIVSNYNNEQLVDIVNLWITNIPNRSSYLIEKLSLSDSDLSLIAMELETLFEHWIFSEFSPNLDLYFVRILEPSIYQWLATLSNKELVTILNEWSKVMSLAKLSEQLTRGTEIYNTILILRDPPVPFGKSVIGIDKAAEEFNSYFGATTEFQGEININPTVTSMKNVYGNLAYANFKILTSENLG